MQIKVMSLNAWYGSFHQQILEFIHQQEPDVILLQEVCTGLEIEIPRGVSNFLEILLADLVEYDHCFAPAWQLTHNQNKFHIGNAILSKFPIKSFQADYFYKSMRRIDNFEGGDNFPGLYLEATTEVNSRQLRFGTTHFLWSLHPEITQTQIKAATSLADILKSKSRLIFGGDMNVTDESEVYRLLASVVIDDRPDGLKRSLHPEIHKVGTQKDLAVDYLFHRGANIECLTSEVPVVPISDHLPILATYEV